MKIIPFLLFFFIANFTYSFNPSLAVGGKLGLNAARLSDNYFGGKKSRYAMHMGGVATMGVGKFENLFLVGEFLFNQKGGINLASGENRISTLDLPILIRYVAPIKKDFPLLFFINTGIYTGAIITRKVAGDADNYAAKFRRNYAEFGMCIGGGIYYPAGPGNVFLEARYAFGLTNVVSLSYERNRLTSFSIGYLYNLKGKSQEEIDKNVQSGFE